MGGIPAKEVGTEKRRMTHSSATPLPGVAQASSLRPRPPEAQAGSLRYTGAA